MCAHVDIICVYQLPVSGMACPIALQFDMLQYSVSTSIHTHPPPHFELDQKQQQQTIIGKIHIEYTQTIMHSISTRTFSQRLYIYMMVENQFIRKHEKQLIVS